MPIQLTRVEPFLYLSTWQGVVTGPEMAQMLDDLAALWAADGQQPGAMVADLRAMTNVPTDLNIVRRAYTQFKSGRNFMVGAPGAWQVMDRTLNLAGWSRVDHCPTLEDALARARAYLGTARATPDE